MKSTVSLAQLLRAGLRDEGNGQRMAPGPKGSRRHPSLHFCVCWRGTRWCACFGPGPLGNDGFTLMFPAQSHFVRRGSSRLHSTGEGTEARLRSWLGRCWGCDPALAKPPFLLPLLTRIQAPPLLAEQGYALSVQETTRRPEGCCFLGLGEFAQRAPMGQGVPPRPLRWYCSRIIGAPPPRILRELASSIFQRVGFQRDPSPRHHRKAGPLQSRNCSLWILSGPQLRAGWMFLACSRVCSPSHQPIPVPALPLW